MESVFNDLNVLRGYFQIVSLYEWHMSSLLLSTIDRAVRTASWFHNQRSIPLTTFWLYVSMENFLVVVIGCHGTWVIHRIFILSYLRSSRHSGDLCICMQCKNIFKCKASFVVKGVTNSRRPSLQLLLVALPLSHIFSLWQMFRDGSVYWQAGILICYRNKDRIRYDAVA